MQGNWLNQIWQRLFVLAKKKVWRKIVDTKQSLHDLLVSWRLWYRYTTKVLAFASPFLPRRSGMYMSESSLTTCNFMKFIFTQLQVLYATVIYAVIQVLRHFKLHYLIFILHFAFFERSCNLKSYSTYNLLKNLWYLHT